MQFAHLHIFAVHQAAIFGIAFAQILPAVSRFSKDNRREQMRQRVFEKLSAYLEKYKDMGGEEK